MLDLQRQLQSLAKEAQSLTERIDKLVNPLDHKPLPLAVVVEVDWILKERPLASDPRVVILRGLSEIFYILAVASDTLIQHDFTVKPKVPVKRIEMKSPSLNEMEELYGVYVEWVIGRVDTPEKIWEAYTRYWRSKYDVQMFVGVSPANCSWWESQGIAVARMSASSQLTPFIALSDIERNTRGN